MTLVYIGLHRVQFAWFLAESIPTENFRSAVSRFSWSDPVEPNRTDKNPNRLKIDRNSLVLVIEHFNGKMKC